MAKRPNKMGRIEADPKPPRKPLPWKTIGTLAVGIALVLAGITGTLKYQEFINNTEARGVSEYKATCQKFTDEEKNITWLECDE